MVENKKDNGKEGIVLLAPTRTADRPHTAATCHCDMMECALLWDRVLNAIKHAIDRNSLDLSSSVKPIVILPAMMFDIAWFTMFIIVLIHRLS